MTHRDHIVRQLKIAHSALTEVNKNGNSLEKHYSLSALVAVERMLVEKSALSEPEKLKPQ